MDSRGNTIFKWEYLTALALVIVLGAAKLAGALDWSWLWVLAPLWGAAALALVVSAGAAALCRFATAPIVAGPPLKGMRWRRRRLNAIRRRRLIAR
ncbi:MAG TPA: hypothetical protein VHD15_15460 [Hyphomicrobiales bacterium]|nr:hypothetical protein [Hyphomicrobiales bacterium]